MAPRLPVFFLLLAGIGRIAGTVGLNRFNGAFSEDFIDGFYEEDQVLSLDTESILTPITSNGFLINTLSPTDDDVKVQEALLTKRIQSRSRRTTRQKGKRQLNNDNLSQGYGSETAPDDNSYGQKCDRVARIRRALGQEFEGSHPLLVQGVDSTQSTGSALITWNGINSSVVGTPVCRRIAAFRIYRQSIWFDDVSQLRSALVGEVRIPLEHAGRVHRYSSWSEKNPPTISCLYYAVTVVCADDHANELEYKKVQPAQPMVIVAEYVESGDAITLHAPSDSGRPGHPAIAQSPNSKNVLVAYDIDTYDDRSETDNRPDSVVAVLLSPSGEELWGRHITHYTVQGERGRPAVVYHEAKQAFFVTYELRTTQYNSNKKVLAGCFVYENGSFTDSYVLASLSAGDVEHFDLTYNPVISGVSVAFQVWISAASRYFSFVIYDKHDGEAPSAQRITVNATSPRLAFDKKHGELYVVIEIDKRVGLNLAQARCSGQTLEHLREETQRGVASVTVLKFNGTQVRQSVGRAVTFGLVTSRNNGLTAFYDESRDAVAFSYTNTVFLKKQLRHYLWIRYFRNAAGKLGSGSCQFQGRSSKNIYLPVRHPAAVYSPINRASFIIYETRRPTGQWTLGTLAISKDVDRWRSNTPLYAVCLYDETCKCFLVCWQHSCGSVIHCQRYSPLQQGYCISAREAKCLARINRRPSCESWCGSRNASAVSYCTACDPLPKHLLSSGRSAISTRARRPKKGNIPAESIADPIYTQCPYCGCRCPNVSCRKTYIIGGTNVEPHCWPWMVYLKDVTSNVYNEASKPPFCGGTLINPRFVLTAAHCVRQKKASEIAVYAGKRVCRQKSPEGCEQRQIGKKVVIHEDYDDATIVNDIAIIKLKKAFHLNQQVRTVCLPDDDCSVASNSSVYVVGCGVSRNRNSQGQVIGTKRIKQIVVPIISNEACQKAYPNRDGLTIINENMFCAGSGLGESDTCSGDSGGGAFVYEHSSCRFVQVGLVSWGEDICGKQGKYTVFTKVYNYLKWIKNIVNQACN